MAQEEVFLTRLDRLEVKLDKLTEAVSAIARVEEKVYSSNKRVDRLEYRMDLIEADVDKAKEVINKNAQTVKATERFFWVAISAIVSIAVYMVR
jgi:uncharacterized protein (DUF2344 family)